MSRGEVAWREGYTRPDEPVEVVLSLASALGIDIPDRFRTLWRLGDPDQVHQASRPHWESWGISEAAAYELVRRHFVPSYASAVQRCPCEGPCADAVAGSGAACHTAWEAAMATAPAVDANGSAANGAVAAETAVAPASGRSSRRGTTSEAAGHGGR